MDDAGAEGRAAGLKPSVMHLVAGGLGLVRARLELAGIELAEERERVIALLVLAVGLLANAAGLAISDLNLTVLVLAAALPSASNVSLLAERFGADNGRIASTIMTSTTIAFVSFSALAWLLGAGAQA